MCETQKNKKVIKIEAEKNEKVHHKFLHTSELWWYNETIFCVPLLIITWGSTIYIHTNIALYIFIPSTFHISFTKIYFNAHTCEAMCKILQLIYTIQYAPASPHKIIQNDFFRSLKIKMLDIYCNMWQWQKKGEEGKFSLLQSSFLNFKFKVM